MKKLTLRMRLTVLTGCILTAIAIILTGISIYSAKDKFVEPLSKTILDTSSLNQKQSLNKEIVEEPILDEYSNTGLNVQMKITEAKEQFVDESIIGMIIMIIVGIGATYIIAGQALKPVNDLSHKVKNINEHNLSYRIENISTKDEIGDLAASFNKMLDRLEQSFIYQKSFAANAAHELKTPLATIKAGIQVLKLDNAPTIEDYEENIEVTEQSTERLIHVVNDLLTLAYKQTEKFSDNIELKNLFETISQELQPLCLEKTTTIYLDICEETIIGNQTLIYRVFYNLIENALKYNMNNGIVKVIGRPQNKFIHISISDTGIGIPKEAIPYIFEPFFRVDQSRARKLGGTGLGLSIVRTIIEKHKGTISVKSTVNVGTTFEVKLPKT
ncbi:HAMP domain-containing histidine kinase [Lysinibacillus fusiformis]|nr:HAMP domain-containing histidine kinase [Lysinibacillus fusiformis]